MLLCRCEESLLFRSAREVYVYQRGRTYTGSPPLSLSIALLCKVATVSDSRPEICLLYYLLCFFFRITTVVPITAPPLMSRRAIHKTRLLLSPVFGGVVFQNCRSDQSASPQNPLREFQRRPSYSHRRCIPRVWSLSWLRWLPYHMLRYMSRDSVHRFYFFRLFQVHL